MNKSTSIGVGLTLAVALSTGGVLVKRNFPPGLPPGAYSDILIVQDSTQREAPAGAKAI